ncbi:MAG: flagellar protein FlaG [Spirochaetes bacterium]|nr:flagellar protein FlaG [Spirochaetota bacterium]
MYVKNVSYDSVDPGGAYARKGEMAQDAPVVTQAQHVQKPQTQNAQRELSREEVSEVVDRLNKGVKEIHERMSFSYHEKTQRIIVKVMKNDSDEVIREIPSKEAIRLLEHIQDFLGMIVDESR